MTWDRRLVRVLPYPIAKPLHDAEGEANSLRRLQLLVHTFSQAMRLIALFQLNDLVAGRLLVDADVKTLILLLRRPALGHWVRTCRELVPRAAVPTAGLILPEWRSTLGQIEADSEADCIRLDLQGATATANSLDAFLMLRNALAHGAGPPTEELATNLNQRYGAKLARLLERCAFLAELTLLRKVADERTLVALRGPSSTQRLYTGDAATAVAELPGSCFVVRGSAVFSLDPMLVGPDPSWQVDPLTEPVFLYEGIQGSKVFYVGVSRRVETPMHYQAVSGWDRYRAAQGAEEPFVLRCRSQTAEILSSGITVDPLEVQVARAALDGILVPFLAGSLPRVSGALIAAPSGFGKTTYLFALALRLLRDDGVVPLLLLGRTLQDSQAVTATLASLLGQTKNVSEERSIEEIASRVGGRQFVLLVDAVNEARDPGRLLDELDRFVGLARQGSNVRLIATVRAEALRTLMDTRTGPESFPRMPRAWVRQIDEGGRERSFVGLPPFDEEETAQAYTRRQDRARHDVSVAAATTPFGLLSPQIRRVVQTPLLLRLLMETFNAQPVPQDLPPHSVFERFHEQRLAPHQAAAAETLARWSGDHRQRRIPHETAAGLVEPGNAAGPALMFPARLLDQLVDVAVLLWRDDGYQFGHQRYLEFLLARRLRGLTSAALAEQISATLERPPDFEEERGALQIELVRRAGYEQDGLPPLAAVLGHSAGAPFLIPALAAMRDRFGIKPSEALLPATMQSTPALRSGRHIMRTLGDREGEATVTGHLLAALQGAERVAEEIGYVRLLVYLDRWDEAQRRLDGLELDVASSDSLNQARLLNERGYLHFARGDARQGSAAYVAALEALGGGSSPDPDRLALRADILAGRGLLSHNSDDNEACLDTHAQALTLSRALARQGDVAMGLVNVADANWGCHRYGTALRTYDDAIAAAREIAYRDALDIALIGSGLTLWSAGDYGGARQSLEAGLELAEELGIGWDLTYGKIYLGALLADIGQLDRGIALVVEAQQRAVQLGASYLIGLGTLYVHWLRLRSGVADPPEAFAEATHHATENALHGLQDQERTLWVLRNALDPEVPDEQIDREIREVVSTVAVRPLVKGVWERMGLHLVRAVAEGGRSVSTLGLEDAVDAMIEAKASSLSGRAVERFLRTR